MKAILRGSAGLFGLLLLVSFSQAQDRIWISPVFKTPLGHAPSPSNSGYFLVDAYGRVSGPHYYLVPPFPPFNGHLPGPIGQAIMSGTLSHELLMSKKAMSIGDAPLLGQKPKPPEPGQHGQGHGHGAPPMAGGPPMPQQYAQQMPNPNTQVPYYAPPYFNAPMQRPMVPYAPGVAYVPRSPYPMQPIGYVPYYGPPGMVATAQRDPRTGIWQVQGVMPGQSPSPFQPIPGFNPGAPGAMPMQNGPMGPMMPMIPTSPMGPMGPMNTFQPYNPMKQFTPFSPMQGPQPPQMGPVGMQLPGMEMRGPPPQRQGPAYPVHPFTRSPRDFFMWGENMDDERARGNRPFPVP